MKWLSMDSKFATGMTQFINVILLTLWFLIGCVPIITIGQSIIAAYRVTLDMTYYNDNYVGVTKTFWKAWKDNWKHGMLLELIFGGILYAAWISWQLFDKTANNPWYFLAITIFLCLVVLIRGLYIFALEARYENTLRQNLKNAKRIFVWYWKQTFAAIGCLALEFMLFFMISSTLVLLGYIFKPVIAIFTISAFASKIFRDLERKNGMLDEDEEYL
ncbi:MAG: YesL family protein [Eubacteriales bacterium]